MESDQIKDVLTDLTLVYLVSSQKKEKEKTIHGFLTWNSFIIFLNFKAFGPKIFFINEQKSLFLGYCIEINTISSIILIILN